MMLQQPVHAYPERAQCWRFLTVQYIAGSVTKMNLINEKVLPNSDYRKTGCLKRNKIKS
jgi:hypothetical protein